MTEDEARRIQKDLSQSVEAADKVGFARFKIHEIWILEYRMKVEWEQSRRLASATWALAVSTIVLVVVTGVLVYVTATAHG
ncbi:hypothetical protein [Nocardia concava]|uniref:hypothetical protein n=1 Tax=Nocardia concava TaxID=257281 RepID=UPI0002D27767|nr:hypothetical protein [Nocardia concava]